VRLSPFQRALQPSSFLPSNKVMTHQLSEHVIHFPELSAEHARPDGERVAEIARDTMKVEEARGEAVRSRAAGLLGSCGVLLTLTVGLRDSALRDAARSANLLRGHRLLWSIFSS
jgi:hypothetical protein